MADAIVPVEVSLQAIPWNDEPAVISICRDNTIKKHYDDVFGMLPVVSDIT